jgi:hypothetical protein
MEKRSIFKCMLYTFLLCILLAGLASCSSDDITNEEQPWVFGTFFNFSEAADSTEQRTRIELVAKEELPEWLIPIVNDMEEKDPSTAVFTTNWKGKQIFYVYYFYLGKHTWYKDLYYSDGTPVSIEKGDEKALFTADWCLIYCSESALHLYFVREELVDKEDLPDWLIPIVDSLTTVAVHILTIEGQQIYYVYGTHDKAVIIRGYYPDGTLCSSEELKYYFNATDWCLIYTRE